jgi:rhodanese-related sulfurtransferase
MICRSGNRSGQIVQHLIETRSDLFNMVGGMKTWASDGLEILNDTGNPEII